MPDDLTIAFDIGGVISRYPEKMKQLMAVLIKGGALVYILTDMNPVDALAAVRANGLMHLIGHDRLLSDPYFQSARNRYILSANWSRDGDLCKTRIMEDEGIDFLIDDRPDYAAKGDFIGLVLSPRPDVPYYHESWSNTGTPAVCVPPEEYEAFKKWKERQ